MRCGHDFSSLSRSLREQVAIGRHGVVQ